MIMMLIRLLKELNELLVWCQSVATDKNLVECSSDIELFGQISRAQKTIGVVLCNVQASDSAQTEEELEKLLENRVLLDFLYYPDERLEDGIVYAPFVNLITRQEEQIPLSYYRNICGNLLLYLH